MAARGVVVIAMRREARISIIIFQQPGWMELACGKIGAPSETEELKFCWMRQVWRWYHECFLRKNCRR